MTKRFITGILISTALFMTTTSCSARKNLEPRVQLETTYGNIVVKLFNETPLHRDNFLKLVDDGFYDGVLFHRVIADFMIQTGDPNSRNAQPGQMLGTGDVGYTLPAEIVYPKFFHKRGALAAARQGDQVNPERRSSGCQFYIVQGRVFSNEELDMLERNMRQRAEANLFQAKSRERQAEITFYRNENNHESLEALRETILTEVRKEMENNTAYRFTEEQRYAYTTIGGTPHLDGEYTVFGEVVEGLDVVEKISRIQTGSRDRPVEDIRIISARRVR